MGIIALEDIKDGQELYTDYLYIDFFFLFIILVTMPDTQFSLFLIGLLNPHPSLLILQNMNM